MFRFVRHLIAVALVAPAGMLPAQQPAPVTAVMAVLTVRADADQAARAKVMPDEVRATLKLYLDGKIQQWYAESGWPRRDVHLQLQHRGRGEGADG